MIRILIHPSDQRSQSTSNWPSPLSPQGLTTTSNLCTVRTPPNSLYLVRELGPRGQAVPPSIRGAILRVSIYLTTLNFPSLTEPSSEEQSRTPTRTPSPLGAGTQSSRPQTNRAFRTPVKLSNSLPASSPLSPLPATPLKRTSTHPMDHASTPTNSKHSADPLSELFDLSRNGAQWDNPRFLKSKPSKPIAKRMLGRTRTEKSIDDNPSINTSLESLASKSSSIGLMRSQQPNHTIDITPSGSSHPQMLTLPEEQSQSSAPGPSTAPLQQSSFRTYAGRSRSFLVELPTDSNLESGVDADDLAFETRESYKDLRLRWGVDNSEDDPRPAVSSYSSPEPETGRKGKGKAKDRPKAVLPPNMMNDLKSITELRSKGEIRRFMDEVGYLFEGMDQTVGVGVRRGR